MELLAAYSIACHPVDDVLTDAHTHHILRLRAKKIIYWANLSTPVALAHLACYLKQVHKSPAISEATGIAVRVRSKIHCLSCKSGWMAALPVKVYHLTLIYNGNNMSFCPSSSLS